MNFSVEIDTGSGFCNGVVRAVRQAETYLNTHGKLFSLGAIVHNACELERLKKEGLEIISPAQMKSLSGETVLIRAHGEPPATYATAASNNLKIIDCTCPVVLQLQKKVRETYNRLKPVEGQIVIFGKEGHAEVNGLVGQTNGEAIVIDSLESASRIDFSKPIALFSQTTKDPDEYKKISGYITSRRTDAQVFNTICSQVAHRHEHLREFAQSHTVILFVSGKESSNGKVLFELCRSVNPRTYWLESAEQFNSSVIRDGDRIGICGATSTPKWQLEEIFIYLRDLTD